MKDEVRSKPVYLEGSLKVNSRQTKDIKNIYYTTLLISSEGVEMTLYREPCHTKEDIIMAKHEARWQRDVVRFRVINVERINGELYEKR